MSSTPKVVYCHCAFAKVLPEEVKKATLEGLCASGVQFDAVPDLCDMAARRDPKMNAISQSGPVKIAACYPRAVKGLFVSVGAPLDEGLTEVRNLRVESSETALEALQNGVVTPNLAGAGSEESGS